MAKPKKTASEPALGYKAKLWQMADALRSNRDAAEYKHVVLGLIFLKYISDAFESKHAEPLRPLAEARADVLAVENETEGLLGGILCAP